MWDDLLKLLATLTGLVTIRKIWYDGSNSKLEHDKKKLEERKRRRGG
ncbi:hypothetical protein GCM10008931_43170 [Oceanobacillus oncorhynchi subsp. oncorhynchi]